MQALQTKTEWDRRARLGSKSLLCSVLALFIAVALLIWWTARWADRQMREDLLQQARLVSRLISLENVGSLAGNESDLTSPAYRELKTQLARARQASPSCRFLYLLGRTGMPHCDELFFYVDSEPADSKDCSPPGQLYLEATKWDWRVFNSKTAMAYGPCRDRWGTWFSALVPLLDPVRGDLVAVLGMDVDAQTWNHQVAIYAALPAGLAFLLLSGLFVVLFGFLRRSDRRIAQQQELLRKNEELLKFALEGANDGIWDVDLRAGTVFISPRIREMLGLDESRAVISMEELIEMIPPVERADACAARDAHLKGETSFFRAEHRLKTRSGALLWVFARGKVSGFDKEGKPVRMTGTYTDISARKLAETEHKRLMAAIEQSGEMVLITDIRGYIQYVNPAFTGVTGFTREDVAGHTPNILKSGKHDEAFYRNLWDTISSGKVWTGRLTNKRKDGTLYTEDASISPVRDESGRIVNYVGVKRDITEHLLLSAQLLQAQKMESIGRLAGGVAHDFNNMLSVILGNADLALGRTPPEDPRYVDLLEIRKAVWSSADLTRQLLAFARQQIVTPHVIDLNDAVSGMMKMLRRLIGEDVELVWRPGTGVLTVKLDPSQVDQILANLAVNARDAIEGSGTLTIETQAVSFGPEISAEHVEAQPGDYVMLTVRDSGCGMDKSVIEHIFEPFFTTKGVGEGTGLGLATVYGIVTQNHGFITVASEPGAGTTFRIHLPRVHEAAEAVEPAERVLPDVSGHETVLLVEDDRAILTMTKAMLEKLGYRVHAAGSPEEALHLAEHDDESIDLLLTDMVMPGMNGEALAKKLRVVRPALKCLFMSGYTSQAIIRESISKNADLFMQKPFSMNTLGRQVRRALDKS